jgi:hypothetical protein
VQSAAGLSLRKLVIAALDATGDSSSAAIALEGALLGATIDDNVVFAETGVLANDPTAPRDDDAPEPFLLAAALAVRDNVLLCSRRAVALDGRVLHIFGTEIRDNHAIASTDAAISTLGLGLAGSSMMITGNCVFAAGTGIRSSCDGLLVADNKLHNTATNDQAVGVLVARGLVRTGTTMAQILANQIDGYGQAGIQISAPVRDLIVKLNIIAACGNGILVAGHPDQGAVSIENNHLRDIDVPREAGPVTVGGIAVSRTFSANLAGNTLHAIGVNSPTAAFRAGAFLIGVQRARLRDNEAIGIGPTDDALGRTAGIAIAAPTREFEVQHNRVERDAEVIDREGVGEWTALLAQDVGEVRAGAGAFTTVNLQNARALVVGSAGEAFVADLGEGDRGHGAAGSVLGNSFVSRGHQLAVDITARHCLFGDNRVQARRNQKEAVALIANTAAVTSNHVDGGEVSIRLDASVVTVVGNLTTGVITNVPDPFIPLNVRF